MELLETRGSVLQCCNCLSNPSEFRLEETGICSKCIDSISPKGKYESLTDRSDIATVLILEAWASVGDEDDSMYQEGNGYCARLGQFLLFEDYQGFVTFEDCLTEEKAEKRYEQLYADGWGAQEDDIFIDENGREAWQGGKTIPIHPRKDGTTPFSRVKAAIYLHMLETGYYPNVWQCNRYGQTLVRGLR
jgi:hypothetical protein